MTLRNDSTRPWLLAVELTDEGPGDILAVPIPEHGWVFAGNISRVYERRLISDHHACRARFTPDLIEILLAWLLAWWLPAGGVTMSELADLLDALERTGDQRGRPVSAHLDPALNDAAKAAVALGLAESVSALTGAALHAELRRLALRAVLDAHYARRPDDRPHVAEVALFLATVRKLPVADRADLPAVLHGMADVLGADVDPETLLAATVGHLAMRGSAA